MNNTTEFSGNYNQTATNDSPLHFWSQLTDYEKNITLVAAAIMVLFLLQSICFVVYVLRVKRRKRQLKMSPKIDERKEEDGTYVRYSKQPLKQRSDPEIYESLNHLIEDTPLPPPIETLPRSKSTSAKGHSSLTLNRGHRTDDGDWVQTNANRPRLPLPDESEAPPLLPKSTDSITLPRMPHKRKPMPPPPRMQTLPSRNGSPSRFTRRANMLPPPPQSPDFRGLTPEFKANFRSPIELPTEPNQYTSSENELMNKLKKRAEIPSPQKVIRTQQTTNLPVRVQQKTKEPEIDNELLQKLKKRAALIPELNADKRTTEHSIQQTLKLHKPLPPPPRQSDYSDGWIDNFDELEPLEQINMYNV